MKNRKLKSAIYTGTVTHTRFSPVFNKFRYRLFMMYLDLSELDWMISKLSLLGKSRFSPVRFRREDYLEPHNVSLDEAVRSLVEERLGRRPDGPVRLITHLRYFGHNFNPVSFYYCYSKDGSELDSIVAEVTNTPWGESHAYVLDTQDQKGNEPFYIFRQDKELHVSPFMEMNQEYEMAFTIPDKNLYVQMVNVEDGFKKFAANLYLKRKPLNNRSLFLSIVNFPAMTLQVLIRIYWQALKLKIKGVPYVPHPDTLPERPMGEVL